MNKDRVKEELQRTASMTFEEFCFMFTNPEFDENEREIQVGKAAVVNFSGPFSGKLTVKADDDVIPLIAENMLGEDDPTEQQQFDALGEIGNVICGNLLPGLGGSKAVFNIDAPKVVSLFELNEDDVNEELSSGLKLPLDEGLIELKVEFNEDVDF